MKLIWSIIQCPIYGKIKETIEKRTLKFPSNWKYHATLCLNSEHLTLNNTYILAVLNIEKGLVATTWISLPDNCLLKNFNKCSFLFHVYVKPDYRNSGIGKEMIKLACQFSCRNGADFVLLSSDNQELKKFFYESLGFKNVQFDQYLMYYKCKLVKNHKNGLSDGNGFYFRSISVHDLGTIQSIYYNKHWICEENVSLYNSQECEETFTSQFKRDAIIEQYLYSGRFRDFRFLCWNRQIKNTISNSILINDNTDKKMVQILSEKIMKKITVLKKKDIKSLIANDLIIS